MIPENTTAFILVLLGAVVIGRRGGDSLDDIAWTTDYWSSLFASAHHHRHVDGGEDGGIRLCLKGHYLWLDASRPMRKDDLLIQGASHTFAPRRDPVGSRLPVIVVNGGESDTLVIVGVFSGIIVIAFNELVCGVLLFDEAGLTAAFLASERVGQNARIVVVRCLSLMVVDGRSPRS